MEFEMNNRKWIIKEASQEEIKTIQNKRKSTEEDVKSTDKMYFRYNLCRHTRNINR